MISFEQLREAIKSADKKPERYTDSEGKVRFRMIPVDKEIVKEKTLTPAEKKKREEIAKAMERENPGMDMSKKMAIATATAKKVAEGAVPGGVPDVVGMVTNTKIVKDKDGKEKRVRNEAAKPDAEDLMHRKRQMAGITPSDKDKLAKVRAMLDKERGANKAKATMKREEAQLDEISDAMKDRYIRKSTDDYTHANAVRKDAMSTGKTDLAAKMKARMKKRNAGMTRAFGGERS